VEHEQLLQLGGRQPRLGRRRKTVGDEVDRLVEPIHDPGGDGVEAMGFPADDNGGDHEDGDRREHGEDDRDGLHRP
jgi:hypothetical protein